MSAIWGYIDFNKAETRENVSKINEIMKAGYKDCVIDRYGEYVSDNFCMGCGIQYFVPEAKNEVLPIVDEDRGIFFTADAIIDNRRELLPRLGYSENDSSIPDARIIYELFDRYGADCLNDMLGAYSFVYYDSKKNVCHIVNDAIGSRALQYSFEDGKLYFSTLTKPICRAKGVLKPNKQWFVDFLALDNLARAFDYEITPYEGVMRLTVATHYKFSISGLKKHRYWRPQVSTLKLPSEKIYKDTFVKIYKEAVDSLVRNEKVTMLLSGGLDSTSIACMLADSDKAKNIKLRSYTMTNRKDFENSYSVYRRTDETDLVLDTKEFLHKRGFDIDCQFMNLEDVNCWDERKEAARVFEAPYKSLLNPLWMRKGLEESYKYGSRVMFLGSYGNCTISLGVRNMYLHDLLRRKNYIGFIKECNALGKRYKTPLKENIRNAISVVKDYYSAGNEVEEEISFGGSLVKEDAIVRFGEIARYKEKMKKKLETKSDIDKYKDLMFNEMTFYSYTETVTRDSLATGVIFRDPTANKRVIDYCISLPVSAFAKGGIPRRLVREYLKEYMPEHNRDVRYYGVQSADLSVRLASIGDRFYDELESIFESNSDSDIVDISKAMENLGIVRKKGMNADRFELSRVAYTAMVLEILNYNYR